jgi:hypothetical protein
MQFPIKISMTFFAEIEKDIKTYTEKQKIPNCQSNLENKRLILELL